MNEAARHVVIWINHSKSQAQEKASADGKTEMLRYRDTRRKGSWGEEISNEKGNSMERE